MLSMSKLSFGRRVVVFVFCVLPESFLGGCALCNAFSKSKPIMAACIFFLKYV